MRQMFLFSMAALFAIVSQALPAPTVTLTANQAVSWPYTPYTVIIQDLTDPLWRSHGITSNFETFCVQSHVAFSTSTPYFASIDTVIELDGPSLNDKTQKIYAAFLNDSLGGYAANDIQVTIWQSLGMDIPINADGVSFLHEFDSASWNTNGWQYVRVLNLWTHDDQGNIVDIQSQLVMVVPVPGAVLLVGVGTTVVGFLRRRRAI